MIGNRGRENSAASDETLRRLFERCLLVTLISVVVWMLLDKARDVRNAAELSAFRQSLGALRVAVVLERTRASMAASPVDDGVTRNPFLLLEREPGGYAGYVPLADAEAGRVAPGAWFFDVRCPCVGYRPRDEGQFHAASGGAIMVFSLSSPYLLSAREPYRWRGEVVD